MQRLVLPSRVPATALASSSRTPLLARRGFVGSALKPSSSPSPSSSSTTLPMPSTNVPRAALKDVAAAAADASGLTSKEAEAAVRAAFDFIAEEVSKGEKVTLAGFGTFERRERPARQGRNPRTGETISIAAKASPAFVAAKAFKEQVAK